MKVSKIVPFSKRIRHRQEGRWSLGRAGLRSERARAQRGFCLRELGDVGGSNSEGERPKHRCEPSEVTLLVDLDAGPAWLSLSLKLNCEALSFSMRSGDRCGKQKFQAV